MGISIKISKDEKEKEIEIIPFPNLLKDFKRLMKGKTHHYLSPNIRAIQWLEKL